MNTATESSTPTAEPEPARRVDIRRVIRANRIRVYEAWTKPEIVKLWAPPGNLQGVEASNDVRVGGAFRIAMRGTLAAHNEEDAVRGSDPVMEATGVYREVVPNERLVYSWHGSWNPGEVTQITVEFRDVEGGTEVHLMHEGFASERSLAGHETGWESAFGKLGNLFAA